MNRQTGDATSFLTDDRLRDDLLPGQVAPPLPPLQVVVEDTGAGVRVTVVNDGPLGRLNGAVRYDAYHCDEDTDNPVDTSVAADKAAAFARSICVAPSIPATDVAHTQSSAIYSDPKYAAGLWFVCGVGADGTRSAPSEPARITTGIADTTIPGDVTHLQISESGKVSNGTVFSELSVTCNPPPDASNLGGVQMYLKDYLALGDIQEGYFHQWRGSGGINFAPLYPIPRRRAAISLTATSASNSFTAASGLLAIAKAGEQLEILGEILSISGVTDTAITTVANWPKPTVTTSDFVIIGKPRIFIVSVSKARTRRGDIENAPFVDVLMDGNLSAPNAPANIYVGNAETAITIEWDQVAGSTIAGYNIYRSGDGAADSGMLLTPPIPSSGTKLLDKVPQNPNLVAGSTYARLQYADSNFTPYELESNARFLWYVTTTNIRGDESAAVYDDGFCQRAVTNEIDPTQTGRNAGKNYLYNAMLSGTAANQVLANDATQDTNMSLDIQDRIGAADVNPTPGKPYGAAAGQANGTGRLRGYTRWESNDGGSGAAGTVTHQNGDEIHIPAPGAGKTHFCYQEVGAWDEGSGAVFKKVAKGEVYTLSFYVAKKDATQPNGTFSMYMEQYDNNTVKGQAKRRFRDTNSSIVTDSTGLDIVTSELTTTFVRYQAQFQFDTTLSPTKQIRINFGWANGTAGVIVIRRPMLAVGEAAPQWTGDMGDPSISVPVGTTPIDPEDDNRTERAGEGWRIRVP